MNINWPEENKVYLIISLSKSRFSVSFKVNMKNYKNGPYFTVLKHCVWFISSLYPKKKNIFFTIFHQNVIKMLSQIAI